MPDEVAAMLLMAFIGGIGSAGYFWGKARVTRQFLDRFGDMLLREDGRRASLNAAASPAAAPAAPPAAAPTNQDLARVSASLERIAQRFDLVEQRLDFTERLVESGQRRSVAPAQWTEPGRDG